MKENNCRRRSHRVKKALRAGFAQPGAENSQIMINDISRDGICIRSDQDCRPGRIINLNLFLPDGNVASLKGLVRHSTLAGPEGYHIGIEFMEMDAAFTNFMAALMEEMRAQEMVCPSCGAEYNLSQEKLNLAHRCKHCGVFLEVK